MVFIFYFLFRNNGKREQLDGNDFRRCYGNFFSKLSFRKYLITAMFKVLSQQLRGTLTKAFQRYLIIEDFTDVGQRRCRACNKAFDLQCYCVLLFLSNKPSFKTEPSVNGIIFATVYLPSYLSIFCVS